MMRTGVLILPLWLAIAANSIGAVPPAGPATQPAATQAVAGGAALTVMDVDGVPRRPLGESAARATVLIFIAVDCPISNNYAPELRRLMAEPGVSGFDFQLVYCDATQTSAAVKTHRAAYGYTCPALLDPRHELAAAVGATVTPEAAVVQGGRVVYLGRIDNRWADFGLQRPAATVHDLDDALRAIAAGRPIVTPITPAVGCPL